MFTVTVEAGFSATHRVRFADGSVEPQHGHDWNVRAHFSRVDLSDTGMVVDFGKAQAALRKAVAQFQYADLTDHEALGGMNPTAEVVARVVFDRLADDGFDSLARIEVTEAPGCVAAYEPNRRPSAAGP